MVLTCDNCGFIIFTALNESGSFKAKLHGFVTEQLEQER